MTDDLLKRLREFDGWDVYGRPNFVICDEAADRIEELEKALREIADGVRDADKSYVSLFHELQFEAREALGEKKDD